MGKCCRQCSNVSALCSLFSPLICFCFRTNIKTYDYYRNEYIVSTFNSANKHRRSRRCRNAYHFKWHYIHGLFFFAIHFGWVLAFVGDPILPCYHVSMTWNIKFEFLLFVRRLVPFLDSNNCANGKRKWHNIKATLFYRPCCYYNNIHAHWIEWLNKCLL